MPSTLPTGDPEARTTEIGSLYADHENERLVVLDDYENWEDYRVYVYTLNPQGVFSRAESFWTDDEVDEFVNSGQTAYLSGHNVPGNGVYGVFVGSPPSCPVCRQSMKQGYPEYHSPDGMIAAVGYVCPKYRRTNGEHDGYMSQSEAIDRGLYVTVEDYARQMWGSEKATV